MEIFGNQMCGCLEGDMWMLEGAMRICSKVRGVTRIHMLEPTVLDSSSRACLRWHLDQREAVFSFEGFLERERGTRLAEWFAFISAGVQGGAFRKDGHYEFPCEKTTSHAPTKFRDSLDLVRKDAFVITLSFMVWLRASNFGNGQDYRPRRSNSLFPQQPRINAGPQRIHATPAGPRHSPNGQLVLSFDADRSFRESTYHRARMLIFTHCSNLVGGVHVDSPEPSVCRKRYGLRSLSVMVTQYQKFNNRVFATPPPIQNTLQSACALPTSAPHSFKQDGRLHKK
jgi:hypothetical protein